ncbi:MAG: transcriptional regulator NarL [Chthonomonadales bacterium]|nr:transcriptional regulator NarL [Chthonomonadales bacterium]
MPVPERLSSAWSAVGEGHAQAAVRSFALAQSEADPDARTRHLRKARESLNKAIYCTRKAEQEVMESEGGRARGYRVAWSLGEPLTPRELEIAQILATGIGNREIGERIGVSEGTVKTHVEHVIAKLGVRTRVEAVVWCVLNLPGENALVREEQEYES